MNSGKVAHGLNSRHNTIRATILALIAVMGCASCGSTKVYTADKTIVYREAIYNVSATKAFTRKTEGIVGDNQNMDLGSVDKKRFNELLDQNDTVFVKQVFMFDDEEVVYRAQRVSSWSEYNRMAGKFDSASKDILKFLADKKKTQLRMR